MEDQRLQETVQEAGKQLGVQKLRPDQERAIVAFVKGRVFVCLPTGSGKSICFGVLPLVFDVLQGKRGSICLVVSPLKALMKDQVEAFKSRGYQQLFVDHNRQRRKPLIDTCRMLSIGVHDTRSIGEQHHVQKHAFGDCLARKSGRLHNLWITLHQDMVSHMITWCMQLIQMLAWHIITTTHYTWISM